MEYEYNDDVGINIGNLIYRVLRRWRLIIVWVILGAIALDAFAYLKTMKKAADTKQRISDYQESDSSNGTESVNLEVLGKNLTDKQINEVETLVDTYINYQIPYNATIEYFNNSILMQLNPNEIPTYTLQYYIDTHFTIEYPEIGKKDSTLDIVNSIAPKLLNDNTLSTIAEKINTDDEQISPAYVRELIYSVPVEDTLIITIYGRSEDECKLIADTLKSEATGVFRSLQNQYGKFDYSLICEEFSTTCNIDIINTRQQRNDKLNSTINSSRTLLNNLTDDQKTYFYALLSSKKDITPGLPLEVNVSQSDSLDPSTLVVPVPKLINTKYILVGAFIGLFVVCVYIILVSILGKRLLTGEEIELMYSLRQIGIWRLTDESKGIFKWIDKWLIKLLDSKGEQFNSEESLKMIAAGIRISSEKNNWKKIYITSTANSDLSQDAIAKLVEVLKDKIENVSCGKSICYDPESLEAISDADACVLIEQVDVSKLDEIKTEYNLCNSYNIPVIGYVTIK